MCPCCQHASFETGRRLPAFPGLYCFPLRRVNLTSPSAPLPCASLAAKRRRLDVEGALVVAGVRSGQVTEPHLAAKLHEHVEQIDVDMVRPLPAYC